MSLEIKRDAARRRTRRDNRVLATRFALRIGSLVGPHNWRHTMNVSPEATKILAEMQQRFAGRLDRVEAARPNEIYFDAQMELVPGFSAHLYKKWNARLVSLFADDAREPASAFHLYYIFALDADHCFFI